MAACFFYNREASQVKADFLETARYLGYVKNAQPDEATAKLIEKEKAFCFITCNRKKNYKKIVRF